jgi:cytochrome c biogenesis protein CcmG/thiol:disulfide interchange protein DsbE
MARWARLGAFAVVAASVGLAVVFAGRFGRDPNLVESPLIGRPAPELALPLLSGEGSIDLESLRGEVIVVNFYASWCLECREEHEALVATAESFADAGVRFVQVAYQDAPEDAEGFLDTLGRSPHTVYATDPGSRAAIAFGVFGVPETYFVDPEGVVRGKIQGRSDAIVLGTAIDRIMRGEDPGQQVVGEVQPAPGD